MASIGKILFGAGIGAGLIYALANLLGKKKLGDKLDTLTTASIHNLGLNGLTVRIDVVLNNPTEYTVRIKQPYVRVLVGDKLMGTSQLQNQVIEIKPYAPVKLKEPIYLTIPVVSLLSLAGGTFYKALMQKLSVNITVHTLSSIDLGARWIAYEKKDTITLQPKLPTLGKKPAQG